MTPKEALAELPYTPRSKRLSLLEAVATTAKNDETLRCSDKAIAHDCRGLAYDLRRSGGLKEQPSPLEPPEEEVLDGVLEIKP